MSKPRFVYSKHVEFADGKTFFVELYLDYDELATRMAIKARAKKHRRATLVNGAIVATATEHKPK